MADEKPLPIFKHTGRRYEKGALYEAAKLWGAASVTWRGKSGARHGALAWHPKRPELKQAMMALLAMEEVKPPPETHQ